MFKSFIKKLFTGILMSGSFVSTPLSSAENTGASNPLILIMLGPPGSGKGTQAAMLQEKFRIPHISTGDILRDHIRRQTDLGTQAQQFMEKGHLVPDKLVLDMLFNRVLQNDCAHGYILDGFPRTLAQAEALQTRLKGRIVPIVLNLELSDAKIIERLTKRVICERCGTPYHLIYSPPKNTGICDKCQGKLIQRSDDTEEVITKRLETYHKQTAPLIAYYKHQKILHTVNCDADKKEVFSQLIAQIPRN